MKGGEDGLTIGELNQLHLLKGFIEQERDRVESLRESLEPKSPVLNDMPKAPGAKDKLGDTVPLIVDEEQLIEENIKLLAEKLNSGMKFIYGIEDLKIRRIFILRFIEDLPWMEVADRIGGRETDYSVKSAAYRYIERQNIESPDF